MKKLIETPKGNVWVQAEYLQGQFWIHFEGKTFVVDDERQRANRSRRMSPEHAGDLVAPMPGKVTKILVELDRHVKKGDPIVVLEAMKMEYTVKAGADGKITNVKCKVGDQVVMGQLLVALVPAEISQNGRSS